MAEAKKKQTKADEAIEQLVDTEVIAQSGVEAIKEAAAKETKDGTTEEASDTKVQAAEEKEVKTAKAGKRSAKAAKETEEKQAKEERKEQQAAEDAEEKPRVAQKPSRTRLERRGKNYRKAAELVDRTKKYALSAALDIATKTNPAKFDATVEVHVRLGIDPRHADQNLRDIVVLPAGTGKTVRVAVFADADDVAKAKTAGADIAAGEEFLQQLDKGQIDFDILVATPAMMPKLGKYARTLGPKGLMPNPKSGTVTTDVAKAVKEAKAGRVEYRVDSTGIVHVGVGKVSFGAEKLEQNARAVFNSIKAAKPASVKSTYVKAVYVTTSMGPSIAVENSEI
ncbi:MAG: ribosomal protein [Candidatus Saccharibacteria bacterium]|nr:ribosomal protein [Candidatus Saccharibacteria bacterium]